MVAAAAAVLFRGESEKKGSLANEFSVFLVHWTNFWISFTLIFNKNQLIVNF